MIKSYISVFLLQRDTTKKTKNKKQIKPTKHKNIKKIQKQQPLFPPNIY